MAISIIPTALPNAINGNTYSQYITASGGTAPYVYTITTGTLPTGLTISSSTGKISGTPTVNGLKTFTVTATDALLATGTQILSISTNTTLASKADNYNRLQHFMCALGQKGVDLTKRLKLGVDCCCETNTFNLLHMYWSVLVCYDPTRDDNCLTQTEIDAIWDDVACKTGICFSPYGTIYTAARFASPASGQRILESGEYRITEESNFRITESGERAAITPDGIGYMTVGGTFIVQ